MHQIVRLLLVKKPAINYFNLKNASYECIEGLTFAYIYVSIAILFIYNEKKLKIYDDTVDKDLFIFEYLLNNMQKDFIFYFTFY